MEGLLQATRPESVGVDHIGKALGRTAAAKPIVARKWLAPLDVKEIEDFCAVVGVGEKDRR